LRSKSDPVSQLAFYTTAPHACGYLAGHEAMSLLADPYTQLSKAVYSQLVDYGFRRSGEHAYRPHCRNCNECVPVRVPVAQFQPRRSQRRTWQHNQDLRVIPRIASYDEEHFELYRRYIDQRHPGGGMDCPDRERYLEFLLSSWCDTLFYEFRLNDRLLAVAVVDYLLQGLSAVYTFFDPGEPGRGLGTYAVLWQIRETERLGLPWLYLGYWIKDCVKMSYKSEYRPMEVYRDGRWQRLAGALTAL
jgi:leucyl-tRNA---protein transferase